MLYALIIMLLNNCEVGRPYKGKGGDKPAAVPRKPATKEQTKSVEEAIKIGDLEAFQKLLNAESNIAEKSYGGYTVVQLIAMHCKDELAIPFLTFVRDKLDGEQIEEDSFVVVEKDKVKDQHFYKLAKDYNVEKDETSPFNIFVIKSNWKAAAFLLKSGVPITGVYFRDFMVAKIKDVITTDTDNPIQKIDEINKILELMEKSLTDNFKIDLSELCWNYKWNSKTNTNKNADTDYLSLALSKKKTELFLHLLKLVTPLYSNIEQDIISTVLDNIRFRYYSLNDEKVNLYEIAKHYYAGKEDKTTLGKLEKVIEKEYLNIGKTKK